MRRAPWSQRGAAAATPPGGRHGSAVAVPRVFAGERLSLRFADLAPRPRFAWLALGTLLISTGLIATYASSRPTILVAHAFSTFPGWLSGPLHGLFGALPQSTVALQFGLSAVLLFMTAAYLIAVATVRMLSMRALWIVICALAALLLLTPPLQLTDFFNYIGYARLGALHGLNPYTHVIADAKHDPVSLFSSWHYLHSPYGELFTALTYPLAWLSLPAAYWAFKVVIVLASLGFLWLVSVCARRLGHDPRPAVAFVGLNPVFLVYAMGGFHLDLLMLLALSGALALFLSRHDRAAGALVVVAAGIKITGLLLLPFLAVAARERPRPVRVLTGAVLAAVPLAAMSLILFGPTFANVSDQTRILTPLSVPNVLGLMLGLGGATPWLLRAMTVLAVVVTVYLLVRVWREPEHDWLAAAAWATLALIVAAPWLMPWYVTWMLPLAALVRRFDVRAAAVAATLFVILTLGPDTTALLNQHRVNLLANPTGKVSTALERYLMSGPEPVGARGS